MFARRGDDTKGATAAARRAAAYTRQSSSDGTFLAPGAAPAGCGQ